MIDTSDFALNEALAMRLILAALRCRDDAGAGRDAVTAAYGETESDPVRAAHVVVVLATIAADAVVKVYGEEQAARNIEQGIATRVDFVARGERNGDD